MKAKSVKINEDTYNILKEYKKESGIPMGFIIDKAVKKYIKKDSK